MTLLTASRVETASRCPASLVLPQSRVETPEATAGNAAHHASELAIKSGAVPDWLSDAWPGYTWRAEVKFAIDVTTGIGRELAEANHRDYRGVRDTEVAGTADVVGRGPHNELVIGDLKSFDPNVSRPEYNKQLATLALAATRAYRLDECEVAIKHEVRGLERIKLGALDLDAFRFELYEISCGVDEERARITKGIEPRVTVGQHCRWCDAFNDCPAQRRLAQEVETGAADLRLQASIPCHDDASAAALYDFTKRLRLLLKRADAAIHARAAERPIPLSNGKMLGKVTKLGNEALDGDVTYEVVRARYGQGIADAAVSREASKTKLRAAIGLVAAKGAIAEAERVVLAEVRAKNGATRKPKESIEEYPAHELKAGAPVMKAVNE